MDDTPPPLSLGLPSPLIDHHHFCVSLPLSPRPPSLCTNRKLAIERILEAFKRYPKLAGKVLGQFKEVGR